MNTIVTDTTITNNAQIPDIQLPDEQHPEIRWSQLYGSSYGLVIAAAANKHTGLVLVIADSMRSATRIQEETQFYSNSSVPVQIFPDLETLPYDLYSPHEDIISSRLRLLRELDAEVQGVLIVTINSLVQYMAPLSYIRASSLLLEVGQKVDSIKLRQSLIDAGYCHVTEVIEHGEFAVRGSIIDLYPMGNDKPFRIDLFDSEIESIRIFDPESQRSLEQTSSINLLPAHEFPLNKESISEFRTRYRQRFEGNPNEQPIYRDISQGLSPAGIEYYLPLFFDKLTTLFSYLPESLLIIREQDCYAQCELFTEQLTDRYEQRCHDLQRPILRPDELYYGLNQLKSLMGKYPKVVLNRFEAIVDHDAIPDKTPVHNYASSAPVPLLIHNRAEQPLLALKEFLNGWNGRTLFIADSSGRREFMLDMFRPHGLTPAIVNSWQEFLSKDLSIAICVSPIDQGLMLKQAGLCIITESQLFGERAQQARRRATTKTEPGNIVQNLSDLSTGSPVVHIEHGVGRYLGLQILEVGGEKAEFLTLEYAENDKLYVPVASLHLISRYSGASPENAPLHKLGNDQWQRIKRKARERVHDIAAELLDIYAKREARKGHAYGFDEVEYSAFAATFPFEETLDQAAAIDAVISDMQNDKPMDRVVCGDVGFGKTEVALRATFVAVQDNYQVALLVPTTLLAQQHYANFCDRFADWPVRVALLSRFQSKKQVTEILKDLANGKIDIIIGTHKLIQKSVKFDNLGLMILDEEHRFGVQQKERLKAMRSDVDALTMTATPIPRTLNMSLSGLRDLSIIATPPAGRVAIKTFINQWNNALVQESILRELKRGGQVYFLHNNVSTIEKCVSDLQKLVPEAVINFAHGQMRERDLEQVMLDFYKQKFNVLVCSTIIESGIDIPTANTILINRADKFGLAQLHQLRGRVGRSSHRAYAYLIVPDHRSMTADAKKRLEAIESLEDLGAGFMLASHDLEIRGAGELLGEDQSGQIHEIGYTLYMELLDRAVKSLREGKTVDLDFEQDQGPEIDMSVPALIDETYMPDIHNRLVMYKRIANASSNAELRELKVELIDRFGLLTDAVKNLFDVTELKLKAKQLGIKRISMNAKGGRLDISDQPNLDLAKLIELIQTQSQKYSLEGQDKLKVKANLEDTEIRFTELKRLLDSLTLD